MKQLILLFAATAAACAQTLIRIGEPTLVDLPPTATRRIYSGNEGGFRVQVPPDASRLIVRFEDHLPNVLEPFSFIVRPAVDIPVDNPTYSMIQYLEMDRIRTIVMPLDYRREATDYYIGFNVSPRRRRITGILTATLEYIAPGTRVEVPSTAQIFLAGYANGTRWPPSFTAPANSPPSIPVTAGEPIEIEADGGITYTTRQAANVTETNFVSPSGGLDFQRGSDTVIVWMTAPRGSLVAMFQGPERGPLSSVRFESGATDATQIRPERPIGEGDLRLVRPSLNQPFYVGTGLTTLRQKKVFLPPAGATRLFFGVFENTTEFAYSGSMRATVRPASLPAAQPSGVTLVHATTHIMLAGRQNGDLYGRLPATYSENWHSPVRANVDLTPGSEIEFAATGDVILGLLGLSDPNGGRTTEALPAGPLFTGGTGPGLGFGGITAPRGALTGVFLGDQLDGNLRPPSTNAATVPTDARIEPALQQPFFIGTGRNANGQARRYVVPPGARRLFLSVHQNTDRAGIGQYKVAIGVRRADGPAVTAITSGAGFGRQVSPGQIASLFGTNLGPLTSADRVPLPTTLAGVEVWFDEFRAPLYFVSPGQVNVQVPWELRSRENVVVVLRRDGVTASPLVFAPAPFSGGIFTTGAGAPVIVNARTGTLATSDSPARRGDTLVIYTSGQGPVLPLTASGEPASTSVLSPTLYPFRVAFSGGGVTRTIDSIFSGLAPGLIGVYQVNVTIPADAPVGNIRIKLESDVTPLAGDYPFIIEP